MFHGQGSGMSGISRFDNHCKIHKYPVIGIFVLLSFKKINVRSGQRVLSFQSQQLTTGSPPPCQAQEAIHTYHGVHNATLVKIEEASTAAYNKAIYLILLIGFLMLCGNIWFWLCFVIRRQGHSCCGPVGHLGVGKDSSCETELVTSHSSSSSLQNMKNYYQTEYPNPEKTKPGSDGLLRKRSLAQDSYGALSEGQSISFISNGSVPGRTSTVELVPCLKNSRRARGGENSSSVQGIATLPRHGSSRNDDRGRVNCEDEGLDGGLRRQSRGSGHTLNRTGGASEVLSRSSSQGDGREEGCSKSSSRPYMSTFCHVLPPPLDPLCHEGKGGKQLQTSVSREPYDLQTKFLQPESV